MLIQIKSGLILAYGILICVMVAVCRTPLPHLFSGLVLFLSSLTTIRSAWADPQPILNLFT